MDVDDGAAYYTDAGDLEAAVGYESYWAMTCVYYDGGRGVAALSKSEASRLL